MLEREIYFYWFGNNAIMDKGGSTSRRKKRISISSPEAESSKGAKKPKRMPRSKTPPPSTSGARNPFREFAMAYYAGERGVGRDVSFKQTLQEASELWVPAAVTRELRKRKDREEEEEEEEEDATTVYFVCK